MFYISALLLQLNMYNWVIELASPVLCCGRICETTSHGENEIHMCRQLDKSTRQAQGIRY